MPRKSLTDIMQKSVSIYAYGIAFLLVLYMLGSVFFGTVNFLQNFDDMVRVSSDPDNAKERAAIEKNLLHTIVFAIVLIKAFTILMAYGETHHINIKYLIEIAIIAPVLEVVFNAHAYSFGLNILFVVLAIGSSVIYLVFYKTLREVNDDFRKHDKFKIERPKVDLKKLKKIYKH